MSSKLRPNPEKMQLRKEINKKLSAMSQEEKIEQSNIIIDKILQHPKYKSSSRISLFLSLPTEVDTAPILNDILNREAAPFVPQYSQGMMRMLRVHAKDVEAMPETSWGIKQHAKNVQREDALDGGLQLVIAPGAAFTASGWRLGHGGGYYDRYLAELKARHQANPTSYPAPYVVAVAFRQQICDQVPVDEQDVRVDEVITAD